METLQRWVRQYREMDGVDWQDRRVWNLVRRWGISEELVKVVEGLALHKPRRLLRRFIDK